MAEIDGEMIYGVLRGIQQDIRASKHGQGDDRLDRIEKRLALHELAESQRPFDHGS